MDPTVLTVYKSPFPKIRLGKDNDGGYVMSEIPNISYNTLIAGGIADDISFEEQFIKKYKNVECFLFDGTIDKLPVENLNENMFYIKKNIGAYNDDNNTNLHDIINSHSNIFIKMDIEGGEIPWIKSLTHEQMNKFEQIVMEFHLPFSDEENYVFNKINQTHVLVHFHPNNACGVRLHKNVIIPNVFECTYLHKKYFVTEPELNTDLIPSSIDMKNLPWNNDICISWEPFVSKVK